MCLNKLLELFKPSLPHPEEPKDDSQTVDNYDHNVLGKWLLEWGVPAEFHTYWGAYTIIVSTKYESPSFIYTGSNELYVRPEWFNAGILAHEFAHESWSLLTDEQRFEFVAQYDALKSSDKLLLQLKREQFDNADPSWLDIEEIHADCYRYLGQGMPESLKGFYIKLF